MWFSTIYTSVLIPIMLLLDEPTTCGVCNVKLLLAWLARSTHIEFLNHEIMSGVVLPMIIMPAPIWLLVVILRKVWNAAPFTTG